MTSFDVCTALLSGFDARITQKPTFLILWPNQQDFPFQLTNHYSEWSLKVLLTVFLLEVEHYGINC